MINVSSFQPTTQLLVSVGAESMMSKYYLSDRQQEPSVTTLFSVFSTVSASFILKLSDRRQGQPK